jgi:hypothetical protein
MYAQMVKSTGEGVKTRDEMSPEESGISRTASTRARRSSPRTGCPKAIARR